MLKYLWTEDDLDKKISYLEKKALDGHTILIFELAVCLYQKNPTLETLFTVTTPWLKVGVFRAFQDAACINDPSCEAAGEALFYIYQQSCEPLLEEQEDFEEKAEKYLSDKNNETKCLEATLQLCKKILYKEDLPSPKWVSYHGMNQFVGKKGKQLVASKKEWGKIRKNKADEIIALFNNKIDLEN